MGLQRPLGALENSAERAKLKGMARLNGFIRFMWSVRFTTALFLFKGELYGNSGYSGRRKRAPHGA